MADEGDDVSHNLEDKLEATLQNIDVKELLSKREFSFEVNFDNEVEDNEKPNFELDYRLENDNSDNGIENDFIPGETLFESLEPDMVNVLDDGKIKKKILIQGTAKIPPASLVFLHYSFFVELQFEPFDSSYIRGENPVKFTLGSNSLILGFEIAVQSMRLGERSRFLVHPDYAFGTWGVLRRIPPNATVLMDIKIFKFVDCSVNVEEEDLAVPLRKNDFKAIYQKACALHRTGKKYFTENSISCAITNFNKAARILYPCWLTSDEEESKYKKLLMKLYTNLAICYNHVSSKKPEMVCVMFQKARSLDVDMAFANAKLLYHRAMAQSALLDFEGAKKNFHYALRLEPDNEEIKTALKNLQVKKSSYGDEIKTLNAPRLQSENSRNCSKEDLPIEDDDAEMEEEAKSAVTMVLEEFASDKQPVLELASGYTEKEKSFFKSECRRLRLHYTEHKLNDKVFVTIENPKYR